MFTFTLERLLNRKLCYDSSNVSRNNFWVTVIVRQPDNYYYSPTLILTQILNGIKQVKKIKCYYVLI